MPLRRRLAGLLAAAAIAPPLFWLGPALLRRLAPSYRDQGDFFYPLKLYTADRLRAGEIPLWNPLSGAGEPWLANGQAGVFYPPNFLFLIPSPAIAGILFLGAGANAAAFALWNVSLKHVDASVAGSYINLVPVIGVVLAVILGETMTVTQWIGGGIVMAGVWLTDRRKAAVPA